MRLSNGFVLLNKVLNETNSAFPSVTVPPEIMVPVVDDTNPVPLELIIGSVVGSICGIVLLIILLVVVVVIVRVRTSSSWSWPFTRSKEVTRYTCRCHNSMYFILSMHDVDTMYHSGSDSKHGNMVSSMAWLLY